MFALCILLFAAGHMVRDGYPATGSTQLARALGAILCGVGALAVSSLSVSAMVGAAILIGFYTDQKHGEGQNARGWRDSAFLLLSGVTSLVPLAASVAAIRFNPAAFYLLLVGFAKPPIWFVSWRVAPTGPHIWLVPTRLAAMVWGAAVGAAVITIHEAGLIK